MQRYYYLLIAILLTSCASVSGDIASGLSITAAAARLGDPARQERVERYLKPVPWTDGERKVLLKAKFKLDSFRQTASEIDLSGEGVAIAVSPLLLDEYEQVSTAYAAAADVVFAHEDQFTPLQWSVLRQWHKDARTVDNAIVLALMPPDDDVMSGIDKQQLIQDAITLLPLILKALVVVL